MPSPSTKSAPSSPNARSSIAPPSTRSVPPLPFIVSSSSPSLPPLLSMSSFSVPSRLASVPMPPEICPRPRHRSGRRRRRRQSARRRPSPGSRRTPTRRSVRCSRPCGSYVALIAGVVVRQVAGAGRSAIVAERLAQRRIDLIRADGTAAGHGVASRLAGIGRLGPQSRTLPTASTGLPSSRSSRPSMLRAGRPTLRVAIRPPVDPRAVRSFERVRGRGLALRGTEGAQWQIASGGS